jgi:hypothetical protein
LSDPSSGAGGPEVLPAGPAETTEWCWRRWRGRRWWWPGRSPRRARATRRGRRGRPRESGAAGRATGLSGAGSSALVPSRIQPMCAPRKPRRRGLWGSPSRSENRWWSTWVPAHQMGPVCMAAVPSQAKTKRPTRPISKAPWAMWRWKARVIPRMRAKWEAAQRATRDQPKGTRKTNTRDECTRARKKMLEARADRLPEEKVASRGRAGALWLGSPRTSGGSALRPRGGRSKSSRCLASEGSITDTTGARPPERPRS